MVLPVRTFLIKKYVKDRNLKDEHHTYYDHYKSFKHYDLHNPITTFRGVRRLEGNILKDAIKRCILKVAQRYKIPFREYKNLATSQRDLE